MTLLVLDAVTKRFPGGDGPAVERLALAVTPGEILGLIGPSGCGKTTTLRLIAGFEAPDEGEIMIGGRAVAKAGARDFVPPEARGVGIVFQDYALFPHLSVADNVAFGLAERPADARRVRARGVLDLVGLAAFADRYPHELSGGQQQRVALARALAPAPALILLDEPFSNVDAELRAELREQVRELLRTTGTTAVFVTHDHEEAFTLADRVGVLHAGRLEQLDAPEVVYHRPATPFVAAFVGDADFLAGTVTEGGITTEMGTVPDPHRLPPGTRVELMIRPDDVGFTPDPDGDTVIVRRDFRGPVNVYCLRLPSGRRVHSSQPSTTILAPGTRVRAIAELLHIVTFPVA
ncbi:MAG: ABC transporter ATP-binding protein [Candidatus Rokubacteria bacterium]|nr:ABC transporter ATP-binding protein [Candidatus Rokubacteria bacterium]